MMQATPFFLCLLLLASYVVGSIPFGWLLARLKGVDLRTCGSGNIGATNVFRCIGEGWGVLALVLDALKGFLPAFVFPRLLALPAPAWFGIACGMAAVAGHNWPVWLKFKGGKGVSTSAGMLLGIAPAAAGMGILAFAITVGLFRWVSLASMVAAVAAALAGVWLYGPTQPLLAAVLVMLALLVVLKHRTNIRRLLQGTEPKIVGRGSKRPSGE
ncbi:MAG: glycerol-3-phosphate 1-O-acyltransferase PlsY [Verrucomicrobiota bacterium]|nr:glycerol-3-phosphate 1-O-acyltransferase PlsY [Verrucomicrobiota bacterium]